METLTPSPTSEQPDWEPPAWLTPEAVNVSEDWWERIEAAHSWPETFKDAFVHGYIAGYQRGQRRRKVDGTEEAPALPAVALPPGD